VFGSVAVGLDTDASDIDLLVEFDEVPSLMALARLERKLSAVVGHPVEVTPAGNVRRNVADRVRETSVPL
jgi:predicted nucleotidyltransferase